MAPRKVVGVALVVTIAAIHSEIHTTDAFSSVAFVRRKPRSLPSLCNAPLQSTNQPSFGDEDDDEDDNDDRDWLESNAELVTDDYYDDEDDWTPDRVKARRARKEAEARTYKARAKQQRERIPMEEPSTAKRSNTYTQEEEELISAMGGKERSSSSKREAGFLGDSTLNEIAMDYSVPVCYLADVLTMWGVPVPIDVNDRLGDLATGEQAFAILEAIYSLDVAALHDRYSNQSLVSICDDYDIELRDAFEMAMKEGWSLPFGVQTCLRVEQEEELIRVLGTI